MTKCRRTDDGANNVIAFKICCQEFWGKTYERGKKKKLNNTNLLSIDAVANR